MIDRQQRSNTPTTAKSRHSIHSVTSLTIIMTEEFVCCKAAGIGYFGITMHLINDIKQMLDFIRLVFGLSPYCANIK